MVQLRKYILTVFAVFLLGVLVILMHTGLFCFPSKVRQDIHAYPPVRYLQTALDTPSETLKTLKEQRNTLSRQLNDLRQKLGRTDCEVLL